MFLSVPRSSSHFTNWWSPAPLVGFTKRGRDPGCFPGKWGALGRSLLTKRGRVLSRCKASNWTFGIRGTEYNVSPRQRGSYIFTHWYPALAPQKEKARGSDGATFFEPSGPKEEFRWGYAPRRKSASGLDRQSPWLEKLGSTEHPFSGASSQDYPFAADAFNGISLGLPTPI